MQNFRCGICPQLRPGPRRTGVRIEIRCARTNLYLVRPFGVFVLFGHNLGQPVLYCSVSSGIWTSTCNELKCLIVHSMCARPAKLRWILATIGCSTFHVIRMVISEDWNIFFFVINTHRLCGLWCSQWKSLQSYELG